MPGDIAAAPQVRRDLQALLGGRGPDGLRLLPEVDVFRAPLKQLYLMRNSDFVYILKSFFGTYICCIALCIQSNFLGTFQDSVTDVVNSEMQ